MPRFRSTNEYLTRRCAERHLSFRALSLKLGFGHAYIAALAKGAFVPSRERADKIARFFHDDPRVLRVLTGLELPPEHAPDELASALRALPKPALAELRAFLEYLRYKYR